MAGDFPISFFSLLRCFVGRLFPLSFFAFLTLPLCLCLILLLLLLLLLLLYLLLVFYSICSCFLPLVSFLFYWSFPLFPCYLFLLYFLFLFLPFWVSLFFSSHRFFFFFVSLLFCFLSLGFAFGWFYSFFVSPLFLISLILFINVCSFLLVTVLALTVLAKLFLYEGFSVWVVFLHAGLLVLVFPLLLLHSAGQWPVSLHRKHSSVRPFLDTNQRSSNSSSPFFVRIGI